jgi:hypothetical protein
MAKIKDLLVLSEVEGPKHCRGRIMCAQNIIKAEPAPY